MQIICQFLKKNLRIYEMHKEGIVSVTGETWILQNSQKVKETSTPGVPTLDFTSFSLSISLIVTAVVGGTPLLRFPSLKVDSVLHCVQMSPILLKKSLLFLFLHFLPHSPPAFYFSKPLPHHSCFSFSFCICSSLCLYFSHLFFLLFISVSFPPNWPQCGNKAQLKYCKRCTSGPSLLR